MKGFSFSTKCLHLLGAITNTLFCFSFCALVILGIFVSSKLFKISETSLLSQIINGACASIVASAFWSVSSKYIESLRACMKIKKRINDLQTRREIETQNSKEKLFDWCQKNINYIDETFNEISNYATDLTFTKDYEKLSHAYYDFFVAINCNYPKHCVEINYNKIIDSANEL